MSRSERRVRSKWDLLSGVASMPLHWFCISNNAYVRTIEHLYKCKAGC